MNARKQQETQAQDKLNLSLLGSYAQQNRDITKDPSGDFKYGGQGYSVGPKTPDLLDSLKAQQNTPEALVRKQATDALAKDENFKNLMRQGKYGEADKLKDKYIQIFSGQYVPEENQGGGGNWFTEGLKRGTVNGVSSAISGGSPVGAAMATAGLAKKGIDAVFGKKKSSTGYKNPGALPNGSKISDAEWNAASLQQQQALLDKFGLR